ncbi:SDR family NAD(P)-dependent oxidoreductase [Thermomonospora umbrina]|uniref:Ketoreductase domain-containing protein n=1 Tax=Thermomonospora umbrina TaxID=111806 RepID=A0A3D9ST18_9ACTN|nr:SDR family oxidoreductase [Thermomonospora umbrina]REE98938.1 hypothetical protein DFJ69_4436 [Thermomonospora umbrina]
MRQEFRTALVTGASSGIGEAFAGLLAARGTDVVLVARRGDLLDDLARRLSARHGVAVEVVAADLTDPEGLGRVEERLRERPVDLLVNNAGYGAFGAFGESPLEEQLRQIDLNVVAVVRLTHAVLSDMLRRGRGGVLNVASMSGLAPSPGAATYGATKAYVVAFSDNVHAEVRPRGVHVTALCPGFTRTDESAGPDLVWLRRADVARAGLDAVAAGRALCVPGAQYKAMIPALRLAPRALLRSAANRAWQQAAVTKNDG